MATRNARTAPATEDKKVASATSKPSVPEVKAEPDKTVKAKEKIEIGNDELIEVQSIAPNVSYRDSLSNNLYEWFEIGDIVEMPFEEVKNMWRNHRGYFEGMALKPLDERVPSKLRFGKDYAKFDELSKEESYEKSNIDSTLEIISYAPDNVKVNAIGKIKGLVSEGKLSDVGVLKKIEEQLNVDLISLI